MHVFERHRHVDEDVADVLRQDGVLPNDEMLKVRALHILHETVESGSDLPMLDVADDVLVIVDVSQNLAAADKAASREKVEAKLVVELAQGERLVILIRREPDVRHAAAVD